MENRQYLLIILFINLFSYNSSAFSNNLECVSASLSYQNNFFNRGICLSTKLNFRHHVVSVGILTIINDDFYTIANKDGTFLYHTAYPNQSFVEYFSYNFGYQYVFKIKSHLNFEPYCFFNENIGYNKLKSNFVASAGFDKDGVEIFTSLPVIFKPSITLEHIIGAGFQLKVIRNLYVDFCFGIGYSMRFLDPNSGLSVDGKNKIGILSTQLRDYGFIGGFIGIEHAPYLNFGVSYKFYSIRSKEKKG